MSTDVMDEVGFKPRILVFSTHNISDPGIDLAGSRHMHYPAPVSTIAVPCSSGLKPSWIVHALKAGIDGVFIASDGEECAYLLDCSERTARIAERAQELMRLNGIDPQRLKMAAVCSVCAESFVKYMTEFSEVLVSLGPVGAVAA
jgi:coenzyme F420-reducing hydrogenase delta subunit